MKKSYVFSNKLLIIFFLIWFLCYVSTVLVFRELTMASLSNELPTYTDLDYKRALGYVPDKPKEDYYVIFNKIMNRGTGRSGFLTGSIYLFPMFFAIPMAFVLFKIAVSPAIKYASQNRDEVDQIKYL